jgi:hypothetical protein
MDEHRIGLKPIVRGVWAPIGERPIALGHHRFEWLYVTGFVEPATGRTVWNIANAMRVGTGQRTSPYPMASASCFSPPTARSYSRRNIFGYSSTNRSPTAALRPSPASTRRLPIAALLSFNSQT